MTDTAEYWWDIKSHKPYIGTQFYHIPNANCGHRHLNLAIKIGDVNCHSCLKLIESGFEHQLPEGKTDFRSKGQKKRDKIIEQAKIEQEKLGKCTCGCWRVKRTNKSNGTTFLGCSNYPKCKQTYSPPKQ